jgi:hypothetical protein
MTFGFQCNYFFDKCLRKERRAENMRQRGKSKGQRAWSKEERANREKYGEKC